MPQFTKRKRSMTSCLQQRILAERQVPFLLQSDNHGPSHRNPPIADSGKSIAQRNGRRRQHCTSEQRRSAGSQARAGNRGRKKTRPSPSHKPPQTFLSLTIQRKSRKKTHRATKRNPSLQMKMLTMMMTEMTTQVTRATLTTPMMKMMRANPKRRKRPYLYRLPSTPFLLKGRFSFSRKEATLHPHYCT